MVLSMTCAENKKTLLQQSEMSGLREWIVDIGSPTAQFECFSSRLLQLLLKYLSDYEHRKVGEMRDPISAICCSERG